jgi:hypothetical protein
MTPCRRHPEDFAATRKPSPSSPIPTLSVSLVATLVIVLTVACFTIPPLFAADETPVSKTETAPPLAGLSASGTAAGEPLPPVAACPTDVKAFDSPNDHGRSVTITWVKSTDDVLETGNVTGYAIMRCQTPDGVFEQVSVAPLQAEQYLDTSVSNDVEYYYKVGTICAGVVSLSEVAGPAVSRQQWYDRRATNLLVISTLLTAAILLFVFLARKGKKLYIRRIAGIEAVDEAVGRATEMGKPILFIPGIQDMDNVQTVAGLTILASVGKLAAQYETKLEVPVSRSLVMSTGRETLKQAYLSVGRPDLYSDDMVHYVTDEQFGYVAAVDGIMVRDKPATCFYMGAFFAESLILAETGNSIGAIQIAGTAMPTQLPFFVAACDYTLIGEELFAASAYLSQDERMIGSLKGQDVGKAIAMIFIIVGSIVSTVASVSGNSTAAAVSEWLRNLFRLNF